MRICCPPIVSTRGVARPIQRSAERIREWRIDHFSKALRTARLLRVAARVLFAKLRAASSADSRPEARAPSAARPSGQCPRLKRPADDVDTIASLAAWPQMAGAFEAAIRGKGSKLLSLGRSLTTAFSDQVASPGLPAIGLVCADSPAQHAPNAWRNVLARFTRASHIYGPVIFWWRWAMCAQWPARSADRYTGPWNAKTRTPILVIGTDHDPNTPYANARHVARLFGNAVLLTHDGYSHTSARGSQRVRRARNQRVPRTPSHSPPRHRLPLGPSTVRPEVRQTSSRRTDSLIANKGPSAPEGGLGRRLSIRVAAPCATPANQVLAGVSTARVIAFTLDLSEDPASRSATIRARRHGGESGADDRFL